MKLRLLLGLTSAILIAFVGTAKASPLQVENTRLAFDNSESTPHPQGLAWDQDEFSDSSIFSANLEDLSAAGRPGGFGFGFSAFTSNDIRLSGYQQSTLTSAPGATVTFNLQNFVLSGHSTLSLAGDVDSVFVINITNQFSLSQSARIVLSGGLQWNHVFFNILGNGSVVSLSGKSSLSGIVTASQRTVRVNGHAIVYGKVFAGKFVIRQAAQIITPPIVSE